MHAANGREHPAGEEYRYPQRQRHGAAADDPSGPDLLPQEGLFFRGAQLVTQGAAQLADRNAADDDGDPVQLTVNIFKRQSGDPCARGVVDGGRWLRQPPPARRRAHAITGSGRGRRPARLAGDVVRRIRRRLQQQLFQTPGSQTVPVAVGALVFCFHGEPDPLQAQFLEVIHVAEKSLLEGPAGYPQGGAQHHQGQPHERQDVLLQNGKLHVIEYTRDGVPATHRLRPLAARYRRAASPTA